ncbi:double-strand break repair helicase AddA [Pseudothioclava arenosa]|uniref:DNA 3'-5' helicase n=1 Tax=Pseudothioclava arenosa TaxID=1795308 RepID=A0A2A4CR34_9RHOB|nr:double-strand break repair helicase AddA [Pseudothioclava arenosa]PCD76599.1 double-strand break repair helicase AddA [Pseudothioclava arenosa]
MSQSDTASQRQMRAASPESSVWLSANAGSGKTKVLTDRVARLLMQGTEPQKILCLTYTKAAAAEMQNRLLKRLGEWAMLPEADLRKALAELGIDSAISEPDLAEARRLFAKAIEAPGGLKIQTIHSFCSSLLRRFPLEAGVPHGFAEMDERATDLLAQDLLEEIASGPQAGLLDDLLRHFTSEDLSGLLKDIIGNRTGFPADLTREDLMAVFDLPPGLTPEALLYDVLTDQDIEMLQGLVPFMRKGSVTDVTNADIFAAIGEATIEALTVLEGRLLTGAGPSKAGPFSAKIGSIPTKPTQKLLPAGTLDDLNDLMERVAEARPLRLGLAAVERNLSFHRFARAFLDLYAQRKRLRGLLDFDDLIERAGYLLSTPSVAQWVLFRLDGGIDHILVDEAQDTSPGQWRVIERLADEFTSGESARAMPRTIFVVGDRKQSIYSFQGADLRHFEAVESHFSEKFMAIQRPLRSEALLHSFRSSPAILRAVDRVFESSANAGLGGKPEHIAFFEHPGRVDIWPAIEAAPAEEDSDWELPIDLQNKRQHNPTLAQAIAEEIAGIIAAGTQIPSKDGARRVHEGDFLILVQRRSELFHEVIRACKAKGLAIAGADRLKLGAELAVKDIRSVLAFLATPEDDLALAEALRSPLFGLSEQALYDLAQPRKGYLWEALRHASDQAETREILQDLRNNADFLRPFELIERLLTHHGGREKLLARLGPEAEDGIDELLAQALAFERNEVPSLTGFLGWLSADEVQVKRQIESAGKAIRVMTVHGSKGLEAPIVILPETMVRKNDLRDLILEMANGVAVLRQPQDSAPLSMAEQIALAKAARDEERMRLLYVAMTRAEHWLIVAGAGKLGEGEDSWYSLVKEAMGSADLEPVLPYSETLSGFGQIERFASGKWPAPTAGPAKDSATEEAPLPSWFAQKLPAPERPTRALSPSDLGGAKALPGEANQLDTEAAMRRGTMLHLLLEHLPELPAAEWRDQAISLLSDPEYGTDLAEIETILAEATRVLQSDAMQPFLVPGSLAEVEVTAELPELGGQRIHGTIDRLVVEPDLVRVLDYKSNATVPARPEDVPLGIVRQMAAYRSALRQIYPGRTITCSILWTADASAMLLSEAQLDAALCTDTAS